MTSERRTSRKTDDEARCQGLGEKWTAAKQSACRRQRPAAPAHSLYRRPSNYFLPPDFRLLLSLSPSPSHYVLNCSSISTWYPVARRFVSFAIPTTAISSANMESVMPALRAAAVCDAMQ